MMHSIFYEQGKISSVSFLPNYQHVQVAPPSGHHCPPAVDVSVAAEKSFLIYVMYNILCEYKDLKGN